VFYARVDRQWVLLQLLTLFCFFFARRRCRGISDTPAANIALKAGRRIVYEMGDLLDEVVLEEIAAVSAEPVSSVSTSAEALQSERTQTPPATFLDFSTENDLMNDLTRLCGSDGRSVASLLLPPAELSDSSSSAAAAVTFEELETTLNSHS
jgi:uncharacterized membrane protein